MRLFRAVTVLHVKETEINEVLSNQAYPGRAFLWQTEVEEHTAGMKC